MNSDKMNSRIFMKNERYKFLFKSPKRRMPKWLIGMVDLKFEKNGWSCFELDQPSESMITDKFLKKYAAKINFIREYEINCQMPGDELLDELLEKYLGKNYLIPFDLKKRKKLYPLAFEELKGYMKKYIQEDVSLG